MKPKNFAKWMLALKSNKYKQGKKYLHRDDTYCALGVLCDLSKEGEWVKDSISDGVYSYKVDKHNPVTFPPDEVMTWSGMRKEDADLLTAFVSQLNDKGKTFAEIAEALEAMYKVKNR